MAALPCPLSPPSNKAPHPTPTPPPSWLPFRSSGSLASAAGSMPLPLCVLGPLASPLWASASRLHKGVPAERLNETIQVKAPGASRGT